GTGAQVGDIAEAAHQHWVAGSTQIGVVAEEERASLGPLQRCEALNQVEGVLAAGEIHSWQFMESVTQPGRSIAVMTLSPGAIGLVYPGSQDVGGWTVSPRLAKELGLGVGSEVLLRAHGGEEH